MKTKLLTLAAATLALSACSLFSADGDTPEIIIVGSRPANAQPVILLQDPATGNLACCSDTAEVSAEECARALEKECYVRVQDIPYRPAKYDFLTKDTYPTRRWRENERAPRW